MKVTMVKQIHSCFAACSTRDRYVHRVVDMPCAPTLDWTVFDETVVEIEYNDNGIIVYVEPNTTFYSVDMPADGACDDDLDKVVNSYIKEGWSKGSGVI